MTRVWDTFLTERDQDHVAIANKRKPVGWGSTPALLMIDNYQGVFSEPGVPLLEAIKSNPSAMGEDAWTALAHVKTLLEHARAANIPVIHITAMHGNNMMGWSPMVHAGDDRGKLVPSKPADTARSQIMPDAAPLSTEVVLQKTAPSAFWGTPLPALLNWLGVDTLIVGGESASGCVRASVVDAAAYRYRVVVAEECTYDRHEASRAINLFDMHEKYADVLPLDEVLEWVDKYGADNRVLVETAV
ncbi:Hydrolase [Arthrobacter sp. 9AX]|uniref:isochorismatase family protein n=1 Tax=Arthrobacter sp. 9AX TaxID=2653131 RepID=UPI0012F42637|nr:isochorismatase family protein [Arthrobacter sp. 9AX]VXB02964.1 Hydrolase [Arthrobacter sp. 9AX]